MENYIKTIKDCVEVRGKETVINASKIDSLRFSIAITKVMLAIEEGVLSKNDLIRKLLYDK
ncbi:MAG TPA: hypothetical protein VI911_11510 [Patescibacteria group bacterium]|nr:hypothetical protein [Patescibacteria group bacterium]